MVTKSHIPVKQCSGCLLNLGERCAVFDFPAHEWRGDDCDGYNNIILIKKYRSSYAGDGAHERKRERVEKAKISHTLNNRPDGKHDFAARRGVLPSR